jgi:hypothetical protein
MTNATPNDAVNHPSHYTQYPVEVIELTRHMTFNRGNAVKYVARAGYKGGPEKELEDIDKAIWYLIDERKLVQGKLEAKKAEDAEAEEPFTLGLWKEASNSTDGTWDARSIPAETPKTNGTKG